LLDKQTLYHLNLDPYPQSFFLLKLFLR
jgi:hypothetical protein